MSRVARWYKRRPYIHFDLPLSKKNATKYVSDTDTVIRHTFYPFIAYTLLKPRFRNVPKERKISYPAHRDGYIFSYYKAKLEICYEKWLKANGLEQAVTAFRRNRENNVTLAKKAFAFIKANPGCRIVATDVESFFDNINHQKLKETWGKFLNRNELPDDHYAVYKAITRYSVVQKYKIYNLLGIRLSGRIDRINGLKRLCSPKQFRDKVVPRGLLERNPGLVKGIGIPQGSSLSPLLSNMYMAKLDSSMHYLVTSLGGNYWRYCDDILIVLPRGKRARILGTLDQELKALGLKRSLHKTQKLNSNDLLSHRQLQYLGFIFNGRDVTIRSSSIHRYHRKLKKGIYAARKRREQETRNPLIQAPLRRQALYNMYSELPIRGKKIKRRKARQKYRGNFTHYMERSSKLMNSQPIERQRGRVLKKFRSSVRKHV